MNEQPCTLAFAPRNVGEARNRAHLCAVLVFAALIGASVSSSAARAQPVNERTTNLEGTWVTDPHELYFQFSHRFQVVGQDADIGDIFDDGKVVNYPTFALDYGLLSNVMLGVRYSSNSLVAGQANEWQPYLKWRPLRAADGRWSASLLGAWNGANESFDGELATQFELGRVTLIGALRGFSSPLDRSGAEDQAELAVAGGGLFKLNKYVSIGGDYANMVTLSDATGAWSAGASIRIPYTPHTFSLFATNVSSGTLQGVSVGVDGTTFWGFEFTIPFSGHRWGDLFNPQDEGEARPPVETAGEAAAVRRVVEIDVSQFAFPEGDVEIEAGTTVRWINRDPTTHTVTSDADAWPSAQLEQGGAFEFTFTQPGRYEYHCTPHPFMTGVVVVAAGANDR